MPDYLLTFSDGSQRTEHFDCRCISCDYDKPTKFFGCIHDQWKVYDQKQFEKTGKMVLIPPFQHLKKIEVVFTKEDIYDKAFFGAAWREEGTVVPFYPNRENPNYDL